MVAQNIAFGIIAAAIVLAALRVVTTRNVVHAALYLVVVLAGVAAQYILLGAEFVGTAQILIYIGAIVVLFLFGIMLTRAPLKGESSLDNDQRWLAALVAVLLLGVMSYALVDGFEDTELPDDTVQRTAQVGRLDLQHLPGALRGRLGPAPRRPRGRHRDRQEGLSDAPQPVPPPGRRAVLHRRLRRARPAQRRAGAHVDRADPQRGQHQPGGLRGHEPGRRRAGLRPVRHHRRGRRGRRRPGHRPAHLPQPPECRPRRRRPHEGLGRHGLVPRKRLDHPPDPGGLVRPDPGLRQAPAQGRLRDRPAVGRHVLRPRRGHRHRLDPARQRGRGRRGR